MRVEPLHDLVCSVLFEFRIDPVGDSGCLAGCFLAVVKTSIDCFFDERIVLVCIERVLVGSKKNGEPVGCELSDVLALLMEG